MLRSGFSRLLVEEPPSAPRDAATRFYQKNGKCVKKASPNQSNLNLPVFCPFKKKIQLLPVDFCDHNFLTNQLETKTKRKVF